MRLPRRLHFLQRGVHSFQWIDGVYSPGDFVARAIEDALKIRKD